MVVRGEDKSDSKLMAAVREGDLAQLGALFERHHGKVHALAFRMTGSAETADDLTQETFLRILRYRDGYRGESRFTTWMYRLARNVCLDHLQRTGDDAEHRRRWARDAQADAKGAATTGGGGGGDDRLAIVEAALARLAPEKRVVLVLSRFHDLRYDEIARILECEPGAVRVRVHRALHELRQLCKELERGDHELRSGCDAAR